MTPESLVPLACMGDFSCTSMFMMAKKGARQFVERVKAPKFGIDTCVHRNACQSIKQCAFRTRAMLSPCQTD